MFKPAREIYMKKPFKFNSHLSTLAKKELKLQP